MKFEVGDTVLLLHSNEEGTVVEILNEQMLLVNVEGVEFPVFTDQVDFPYFNRFSKASKIGQEKKEAKKRYIDQVPAEKNPEKQLMPEAGVQLKMIPLYESQSFEDNITHFKLYLLNTLAEAFQFEYRIVYKDIPDFVLTNTIDAQKDFYLNNISQEALNDIVKFRFLFSSFAASKSEPIEVLLKIRPKILFQKIDEMHRLNEPSISFLLFDKFPDKPPEPYFPLPEKRPGIVSPETTGPVLSVVDLHIEKIMGSSAGLSNYEMLQAQLQYFEKYYNLAVAHMQPKLIVIHGIGSGRLREEIHELLRLRKEVKSFVNQYHPNFGFGATEIYFQY